MEDRQTAEKPQGHVRGLPRATRVKNKSPASIQITAEQILREAMARQDEDHRPPKNKITDPDELEDYRMRKRKAFEDAIRRNRSNMSNWLKYAMWEESQKEFERARSVFERAVDVDYRNQGLWLKYAEMEMKHRNINAARNVWDRAVTLLPRTDQFWLKYALMEDLMGNYAQARQIFERWMEWEPEPNAWNVYIKFEIRCGEIDRARKIYDRFVHVHPTVKSWLKWAKFEEKYDREKARKVYEDAIQFLDEDANDEKLFISFAKFEERAKEIERARAIYKYALDHIPKKEAQELYKMWVAFEKKNGDKEGIEEVIIGKRRFQYEEEIKQNASNYDTWFDYVRLEETYGDIDKTREVYERAISVLPPVAEKRYWRRYVYLWINYALFEELQARDIPKTRDVYKACARQIPHKVFSFSKIWIMYANFEIRQKNLDNARQIFGHAIGIAPKDKIFREYTNLELQLGNVERCRVIYEKWLEFSPANCNCWIKFAHLEKDLGEFERARAIFELSISQPLLDMPELLWKSYIDFEIEQEEDERARLLYRRLLERTKHVKVWISFAQFEASLQNEEEARSIYSKAFDELKSAENKEERVMLIESWKEFEDKIGKPEHVEAIRKKLPKKVIKKRQLKTETGEDAGWEEYIDYIFPGEEQAHAFKLLEQAKKWKKQKQEQQQ